MFFESHHRFGRVENFCEFHCMLFAQISMILIYIFNSLFPVIEADLSDSGCVDNVLELLVMAGGRSLPEVKLQPIDYQAILQVFRFLNFFTVYKLLFCGKF